MSKDFLGIELFKTGTWTDSKGRKRAWTVGDLNEIVKTYDAIKDEVHAPLKLGHNDAQEILGDDAPAIGWIENIKRKGNTLVADIMRVPDKLATLINEGAYRARSVELQPDFEIGEKTYKWALTGVALLGNKLPAVSGLQDILALYEREGLKREENSEIVFFESEGEDDELETLLEDVLSQLNGRFKGKRGAPHVRALETALRSAIRNVKGRSDNEMANRDELIKLLELKEDATDSDIESAIKSLKKPEANHELADKLTAAETRILQLEQDATIAEANKIVDDAIVAGRLLPKQREFAVAFAKRDSEEFKKFVESQPKLVDFASKGDGDGTKVDFAKYEPTESEISVAKAMNTWTPEYRLSLMRSKAQDDGVILPTDFGK